eukprot:3419541-Pyramimonas_sp.AAC.1
MKDYECQGGGAPPAEQQKEQCRKRHKAAARAPLNIGQDVEAEAVSIEKCKTFRQTACSVLTAYNNMRLQMTGQGLSAAIATKENFDGFKDCITW